MTPTIKKTAKKAAKKTVTKSIKVKPGEMFEIEETPPPPARAIPEEKRLLLEKVDRTVLAMKSGSAFIAEARFKNIIQAHLKKEHAGFIFRAYGIPDNKKAIRIYKQEAK